MALKVARSVPRWLIFLSFSVCIWFSVVKLFILSFLILFHIMEIAGGYDKGVLREAGTLRS